MLAAGWLPSPGRRTQRDRIGPFLAVLSPAPVFSETTRLRAVDAPSNGWSSSRPASAACARRPTGSRLRPAGRAGGARLGRNRREATAERCTEGAVAMTVAEIGAARRRAAPRVAPRREAVRLPHAGTAAGDDLARPLVLAAGQPRERGRPPDADAASEAEPDRVQPVPVMARHGEALICEPDPRAGCWGDRVTARSEGDRLTPLPRVGRLRA